jgi:TPR repeat protein
MNYRSITHSLLLILLIATFLAAQQPPDSNINRLAVILRLPTLAPDDLRSLFSEADSGNAEAQYWLGRIYDAGSTPLPKDAEKSVYWYQKSAEQGYAPAEYVLCLIHADRDPMRSERCMRRAAEDGVAGAQFWLGVAYERNEFGVTDEREAVKWYRKAAEQGNPDAEVELGLCYEDGRGVEQDYALAAQWFRKAAEHVPNLGGAGQGRNELGLLYMDGLGVPKDYVQAYMWFSLAGTEANLAVVQVEMTPAQILRAQQMADEWKKRHPDPAIY